MIKLTDKQNKILNKYAVHWYVSGLIAVVFIAYYFDYVMW